MYQSGLSLFQVLLWINQSFLLQDDIDAEGSLNVAFMSLRGSGPLFLKMEPQGLVIYIDIYFEQNITSKDQLVYLYLKPTAGTSIWPKGKEIFFWYTCMTPRKLNYNTVIFLQMTIKTDDMDLAGDVIQALCQFLNIDDMQVAADFPEEMEKLRQILVKVRPIF